MHEFAEARRAIETMIRSGDLEGLLRHTETIHGHLCPGVAWGIQAGQYAMTTLNRKNTGMEEVVAIVECNNCFTDGIQTVTGCTFGNNALIFKDLGKTAVTVARREDGVAVRLAVKPGFRQRLFEKYPAAGPLFKKVIVDRQGNEEDHHRLHHLWHAMARKELQTPLEEQFNIQHLTINMPEYARIFASLPCSICEEEIMETRVCLRDGKPTCLACAHEHYFILTGNGITLTRDD
ncbi:MAG: TraR/DksA C4-type zinc finger protein [Deltaproteobacteria bacterium]|nr:TraR/DksA C4-type zinc finger protein [Deltaproteobacteria bacterium]MBW1953097.1 TraR/DksA C4-type zinc finger protein [Deltaproteobacteria bacterium]MBW1987193.1 TraR/DksA C4-type zinc finger protein [Deltaproteobacteria bacterium]MBW2135055.1 TraR/DksA C4-type zinc finger protein [Deltaproteobacteria bacterium]